MGPKKPVNSPSGIKVPVSLPKVDAKNKTSAAPVGKNKAGGAGAASMKLPQVASAEKKKAVAPADVQLTEEQIENLVMLISTYYAAEVIHEQATPVILEEIENEKVAKIARENGKVKLLYEMYDEEFTIVDGSITSTIIDEEYCLSYVMPGCSIHLSNFSNRERTEQEELGNFSACTLLEETLGKFQEEIVGIKYNGLEVGKSYYVFIEQEAQQLKRDQELMKQTALTMEGATDPNAPPPLLKNDGRVMEGCSCIYGNPCMDEYGCRNWANRWAISLANGWKGF